MKDQRKERLLVVSGALLLDLIFGDPPNRWHPVAWMGSLIAYLRQRMPRRGQLGPLLGGGAIALGGSALIWSIGRLILCLPKPLRWLAEVVLLKTTFSLRGLVRAVNDVKRALQAGDLSQARHWLGWHLVSRDTSQLNESQVAAATIESLAENLSDGIVAPLFYYRLGGLSAALAYRYLNTGDAMLGYRDTEREWLGKIPAYSDDLLNLLPARLTAAGILAAAFIERLGSERLPGKNWQQPFLIYQRDKGQTASPNAGHPMSAMAGALGVMLEKAGQYRLGVGLRPPQISDIQRATRLLYLSAGICLSILLLFRTKGTTRKPNDSI